MECDDRDDPFGYLTALCHISDSQEDYLSSCSFAGNHDLVADSEPSLCTGCLSTPLYKHRNRPEASSMAASGVGQRNDGRNSDVFVLDGGRVVNSGRDAELGFHPEVRFSPKSGQRGDVNGSIAGKINGYVKEFCDPGPKKFEVLGNDLCSGDTSAESSCKRLKISEQILALELASSSTGTTNEKTREDLLKIHDSLKIIIEEMSVETNSRSKNTEGESSENRKSETSDNLESNSLKENETIQSMDTNENIRASSERQRVENCSIQSTENNVRVRPTELQGTANRQKLYRILPPWSRKKKAEADELDSNYREITLLDVLKILKNEDEGRTGDEDDGLADMSILEILKSRGMTFPRPSWWPAGGFEGREKTKKKKRSSC